MAVNFIFIVVVCCACGLNSVRALEFEDLARFAFNIGMPEVHVTSNKSVTPVEMANHMIQTLPAVKLEILKTLVSLVLPLLHVVVIGFVLFLAFAGTSALVCTLTDCFDGFGSYRPYSSHHPIHHHHKKFDFHNQPTQPNPIHTYAKTFDESADKYNYNNSPNSI